LFLAVASGGAMPGGEAYRVRSHGRSQGTTRMKRSRYVARFGWLVLATAALGPFLGNDQAAAQATHRLVAGPETVAYGHYDPEKPGVLRIESGDFLEITTMLTSNPTRLQQMGLPAEEVQRNLAAIVEQVTDRGPGGHILTGPIHIEGAEPGDVLEVRILSVDYSIPYGYNGCSGFVPDLCDEDVRSRLIRIDTQNHRAEIAPGVTVTTRPFFGSMGVAPPPDSGRVSSNPPGRHAGNMDLKELVAGTTLYVPVWVTGALFEIGDGHAAQGDGEVNQTGLETSLEGRLQFILHKDRTLDWPRAETPTHHIAMGFAPDLEEATEIAIRETVELIQERTGLSQGEAYSVVSMAVDLGITELVDGNVGVHSMVPKELLGDVPDEVEVLIRGGMVYDGSGSEGVIRDVGVSGDRIVFLGDANAAGVTGTRVINASGLVVSPGFIDPHAHAQGDLASEEPVRRENLNYLMQGVTTVVVGNDGHGTFDIAGSRAAMEGQGIGTNAALLVGFGSVRGEVMGMRDEPASDDELEEMKGLVDQAMRDGAAGLATGLFYAPQSFSSTEEVVQLARVAAAYGGTYDSHMRDESSYSIGLLGSIAEVIRVAEEAEIAVNISHIKALGVDVWGQSGEAIEMIRAARARGLRVTADQYPYEASGSSLNASLLPRWAQSGGRDSLLARFDDPVVRERLVADMQDNMRRRNGPDAMLITGGQDESIRGMTLEDVAAARGLDPIETAIEIIRDGGAGIGSFNMNEDDIATFMAAEFVMTGSDGSDGHPRKYGTYPRKIRKYVLDEDVISMSRMIRASSSQPAEVFGLTDRGRIAVGSFADIAVFDPETIRDESTFLEPRLLATGMRYVLVNGEMAVDEGEPQHTRTGRVLRRVSRPISQ
jgi:N-acyl-D-amino-acid deacylase